MHWTEECYWAFTGSVPFLGAASLAGRAYRDPDEFTKEEAAGSIVSSTIIGFILGKFVPNFAEFKQYKLMRSAQLLGKGAVRSAPLVAPVVAAVTLTVVYEQSVGQMIRDIPGHAGNWLGPYASGLGTVV